MDIRIVFVYSREQALADGELKDATRLARELGFAVPVALTAACWNRCIAVPPTASSRDVERRLWDVLTELRDKAMTVPNACWVDFAVNVRNHEDRTETVQLKAVGGAGDRFEPVVTIMLSDED
jgi:hypothetical protein